MVVKIGHYFTIGQELELLTIVTGFKNSTLLMVKLCMWSIYKFLSIVLYVQKYNMHLRPNNLELSKLEHKIKPDDDVQNSFLVYLTAQGTTFAVVYFKMNLNIHRMLYLKLLTNWYQIYQLPKLLCFFNSFLPLWGDFF